MGKLTAAEVIRHLEKGGGLSGKGRSHHAPADYAPKRYASSSLGMLQSLASTELSSDAAERLADQMAGLTTPFSVADASAFSGLNGLSPHVLLATPAFIESCAARGVVYFLGADGLVHRVLAGAAEPQTVEPATASISDEVDADYWLEPPWFQEFEQLIDEGASVLLIGPAGSGKTKAVKCAFARRKHPLHVVQCSPRTRADDLEGKDELVIEDGVQVTRFTPASPAIACRDGHGLLLDEADAAPAAAMYSIYSLLNGEDMHILRAGLESEIQRHPSFRIVGTQNTEGRGDDRGIHHGRAHQDEAFLDRWDGVIRVGYLHPDQEIVVLRMRTGISSAQAEKVVSAAQALRAAFHHDEIMFTASMRRTLSVAKGLARGKTPEQAWKFAVLNRATPADQEAVLGVLQRVYGSSWRRR